MDFSKQQAKRKFNKDEILFEEGDSGHSMFVLQNGEVEVYVKKGGQKVVLAKLSPGSIFGEMALIDRKPRTATVKAISEVNCLEISELRFKHLLGNVPKWMRTFYNILVERLRAMDHKQLAAEDSYQIPRAIYNIYLILKSDSPGKAKELVVEWQSLIKKLSFLMDSTYQEVDKLLARLSQTYLAENIKNTSKDRLFQINDISLFKEFAEFCRKGDFKKNPKFEKIIKTLQI